MCRINFQRESLETFLLYEVAKDAIIEDLGVIGSPEPVRIVTVNSKDKKADVGNHKLIYNCKYLLGDVSQQSSK